MLETDDELSDLSDSDLEDILDATDVSSDEEFLDEEPAQPYPDTAGSSAPKKHPRTRPNNTKKAKKGSDRYYELYWTSTEPPPPMWRHLFDGLPVLNNIVQSCDLLKIFEIIVTDEIVDHIVTYSNLYANQSISSNKFKKPSRLCKWKDISAPEIRLYLATLIYHGMFTNRKSISIILKTNFLRPQGLEELYHNIRWYY